MPNYLSWKPDSAFEEKEKKENSAMFRVVNVIFNEF